MPTKTAIMVHGRVYAHRLDSHVKETGETACFIALFLFLLFFFFFLSPSPPFFLLHFLLWEKCSGTFRPMSHSAAF